MKRISFFISLFVCLFGFAAFLLFFVFSADSADNEKLKDLQKSSQGSYSTDSFLSVKQERKGVYKELWQVSGKERKMLKIESPSSKVAVVEEGGTFKLIEELSDCDCWMQEKLFQEGSQPMQELRRLKAAKASFSYDEHSFVANHVSISRYLAKGSILPKIENGLILLMKGKAEAARFKTQDAGFSFEADRLKATFYPTPDAS